MATEVVATRLSKEDVKYIEKYAVQLGMKKAPFLQGLRGGVIGSIVKERVPEKVNMVGFRITFTFT